MKLRNLLVAAFVLAALIGAVWWATRHPQSSTTTPAVNNPKLANITAAQVKDIDLKKKDGQTIVLRHQGDKWNIAAPENLPADQDTANTMASALAPVTADSVVEDKPADLSKYGLQNPSLTVTVDENNGKSDQIVFGDDVPAGSLVYARVSTDPKVYAVASSVKSSFDKSFNDLRDKRLLTFNSNQLTRIELNTSKSNIEFGKNGQNEWQIIKPQPARTDSFQVEELLRQLTDAKMDFSSTAEDPKKAQAGYSSGQPVASVKVTDANGTQSLTVHKNKDDYYAQSSVVSGAYKISSDLGKALEKSVDDFRNKKIFDLGFNDPTKIEIQQGSSDKVYVRSGSDWKLNGQTMDIGSVQSLIDKLRDLSATKFVTEGFTTPTVTIAITSDDGKRVEKAEFAKTKEGYIARRANESGLYQLNASAVDDILTANGAIKPAASSAKK